MLPAEIPNLSRAQKLKYFLRNSRKLTSDPLILEIVQGYPPKQAKPPRPIVMSKQEARLMNQKIHKMMRKGAITITENMKNQFLSSLFVVGKKDVNRPIINLREQNK